MLKLPTTSTGGGGTDSQEKEESGEASAGTSAEQPVPVGDEKISFGFHTVRQVLIHLSVF